jgi:hypothetical protein
MQTLYKLIFVILVLKSRKDELRRCALEAVKASKRDLADAGSSQGGTALAHTH